MEGVGIWRRARPHGCAKNRRLVYGWQDHHRRPDHPHAVAGSDQRWFRSHEARRVHTFGRGVLMARLTLDDLELLSEHRCFDGVQRYYKHSSETIGLPMRFSVFIPQQAKEGRVPVLFYLAGLTCTEETFMI